MTRGSTAAKYPTAVIDKAATTRQVPSSKRELSESHFITGTTGVTYGKHSLWLSLGGSYLRVEDLDWTWDLVRSYACWFLAIFLTYSRVFRSRFPKRKTMVLYANISIVWHEAWHKYIWLRTASRHSVSTGVSYFLTLEWWISKEAYNNWYSHHNNIDENYWRNCPNLLHSS